MDVLRGSLEVEIKDQNRDSFGVEEDGSDEEVDG
jgi:hypothetical protein